MVSESRPNILIFSLTSLGQCIIEAGTADSARYVCNRASRGVNAEWNVWPAGLGGSGRLQVGKCEEGDGIMLHGLY